jgi:hypothetical protein
LSAAATNQNSTDTEKVARQIGEVKLLAVPKEGHLAIEASVKFAVKSFEAGDYMVSLGVKEALLTISHGAFDASESYEAKVKPASYHESFVRSASAEASGHAGAEVSAKFGGLFSFGAGGRLAAERKNATKVASEAEYSIIIPEPQSTWRIGSRLGDPRHPSGTAAKGVEHCLQGEYFRQTAGETGRGYESRPQRMALCRLDPKPSPAGVNDQRITALLFGAPGSLRVALERRDSATPIGDTKVAEREKNLREKIIEICLARGASDEHARVASDSRLTGEFFLSKYEIVAPKLGKLSPRFPSKSST